MSDTYEDDATPDFASTGGDPIEKGLQASGLPAVEEPSQPAYRVIGDTKIAVSKFRGRQWKARRDVCRKHMKDLVSAWDEAIRYYNQDQGDHRDGSTLGTSGNRFAARRLNEKNSSTENVVFSNINAQIPALYAKNPTLTVTAGINTDAALRNQDDAYARALTKLINVLFAMKHEPGVNIKPKMKKAVVIALLTNTCWIEVGYTQRDASSDNAIQTLQALTKQLQNAEDVDELNEIEGKLMALEETIEFLRPSGPFVRIRLPHQVLLDTGHNDPQLSDCNYAIVEDMLPTEYLNARYGKEKEGEETVYSIYKPTHVLSSDNGKASEGDEESILAYSDKNGYNAYGFDDATAFKKALRTKVWYVWDKTTRRLELYADNNWTWPIWVWDDPYGLQGFFPLTRLSFHDNPVAVYAKGEVSFYLDQQDQINEINDEKRRAVYWARRNIVFNKNKVSQDVVDAILRGPDNTATGIDLPDGMKVEDVIHTVVPPSAQFMQLFDKKDLYAAIDRIAATNEIQRGGEFKTNTTNKAVDYYATQGNQRNDERLDAVEDCIADVGWKIAQMCLQFMDKQTVSDLTGLDVSAFWKPLDPIRDSSKWSMSCVGGSTTKVSDSARKQEAVQIGQVLSQFVKAAPAAVLKTTLDVFAKAFDDVVIEKEDWDNIEKEVLQTLQMSQGGAPGQNPAQPSPQPPQGPQPQPQPGAAPAGVPGGNTQQELATVAQILSQLPPPLLQAIGTSLAQGVPPQAILQHMTQLLSEQQQPGQQPQ